MALRGVFILAVLVSPSSGLLACSCAGAGSPCQAAGRSAAVFSGTVLDIAAKPMPAPPAATGEPIARGNRASGNRATGPVVFRPWPSRVVRMRVGEVLSGVAAGQKEIEIVTGLGDADCGYSFEPGTDYMVYAYRNGEGQLETGICSRTRKLADAAEDLQYLRAMANAPPTGEIRVHTGLPGAPVPAGAGISVEGGGSRYSTVTDAAGNARFIGLPPAEYSVHADADGDLADDPKVQLHAKGCVDVTLLRYLRMTGRVTTRSGMPAARVQVQFRSTATGAGDSAMTGPMGNTNCVFCGRASIIWVST